MMLGMLAVGSEKKCSGGLGCQLATTSSSSAVCTTRTHTHTHMYTCTSHTVRKEVYTGYWSNLIFKIIILHPGAVCK